ncbi:MAG: histidinol-phosphate transaminase [Acidiferrobacteraceae bacterium]
MTESPDNSPDSRLTRLIRSEVLALRPYAVPEAAGRTKLDAMENPYSWPAELVPEWQRRLAASPLNRYPEASAPALRSLLRRRLGLAPGSDLLLGNGSDEIIQMLTLALRRDLAVLAPAPTFVMYEMSAKVAGVPYVSVPLDPGFSLNAERLLEAAERCHAGLIFIAYPNNPTGNLFDEREVERIIRNTRALVVVDEAYFPFARRTFMGRLGEFDNLLVMRTLSKEGLAGLRLGFVAGRRDWIEVIDRVRLPYNINRLTELTVAFALEHADVLESQAERIRSERALLWKALAAIPGVRPWPSDANFILFHVADADAVFTGLLARGVLIRNLSAGSLSGCLRVTVGTPEENHRFLRALQDVLAG